MKYDEDNKPVLTEPEFEAVVRRDRYTAPDVGYSMKDAARAALDAMDGRITAKFVEFLSRGTLTLDHGDVVDAQVKEPAAV